MRQKRFWLFLALVAAVFILNRVFGWSTLLTDSQQWVLWQESLAYNRSLALLCYIAVTIVGCVLLAVPGVVFALAAGLLFGPFWGTLGCSVATTIGAALAFLVGRYFLRDTVKPWAVRNRHLKKLFFAENGKNGFYLLLVTRLVPVFPYNLQNFAYGITDIGFVPYTLYSFLFMLPGTAVYTIAAAGLFDPDNRIKLWLVAGTLFVLVMGVSIFLRKRLDKDEVRI